MFGVHIQQILRNLAGTYCNLLFCIYKRVRRPFLYLSFRIWPFGSDFSLWKQSLNKLTIYFTVGIDQDVACLRQASLHLIFIRITLVIDRQIDKLLPDKFIRVIFSSLLVCITSSTQYTRSNNDLMCSFQICISNFVGRVLFIGDTYYVADFFHICQSKFRNYLS